ncbi:MAG: multicopper oxidase domain-containing protein [Cryomorphaceae bacterium]
MRWLLGILILLTLPTKAQQVVPLYIVEGGVTNANYDLPYFTFNTELKFDSMNAVLRFQPGEEVMFLVTNTVGFSCAFRIEGHGEISRIETNATETLTVTFDVPGTYLYDDPMGDHRSLGLGGMLVVSDFVGPTFYGVFTEHDEEWIEAISEGGTYDRRMYNPEAFTINGKGFPATLKDSLSFIEGGVGDTILVHMTNAGYMHHFPHWHGYHVKILSSTHHPHYVGRVKDSYGMAPGESVTVELVPDKPGMFPIHNHNLVTTTIGGNYPGGMMMHMHIHE